MLIDCIEVGIKISNNYCDFILAKVELIEGEKKFKAQIVTFQDGNLLIDRIAKIRGTFSSEAAHVFQ